MLQHHCCITIDDVCLLLIIIMLITNAVGWLKPMLVNTAHVVGSSSPPQKNVGQIQVSHASGLPTMSAACRRPFAVLSFLLSGYELFRATPEHET